MANGFVSKSYARLGLEKFIMVIGVIICLVGLVSNYLSGIPLIGGLFHVSTGILFAILLFIIVLLGVL